MKRNIRHILFSSLALLAVSCSKDPDVQIMEELDLPKCLTPVQVKHTVETVYAEINLTTFPDAQKYEIDVTAVPLETNEEPYEGQWTYQATFTPEELPFKFMGPDESECTYQIRALNESKEPSDWVSGTFKTDVDPTTKCATPGNVKADALYNRVRFSWDASSNVAEYILELYSKSIPQVGDPDPESLIEKIICKPTELPYKKEFSHAAKYFFRVRGVNPDADLKPSKWVRSSFETSVFEWPASESAFDYNLTSSREANLYDEATMKGYGIEKGKGTTAVATVDQVTYGVGMTYYGDRFYMGRCKSFDKDSYAVEFPLEKYVSISINKPGSLSFIPRLAKTSPMPEIVLGLLTKKKGVVDFRYVYQETLTSGSTSKNEENRLTIAITEDDLFGIDEPATLYLFCNVVDINVYPIKWIPLNN